MHGINYTPCRCLDIDDIVDYHEINILLEASPPSLNTFITLFKFRMIQTAEKMSPCTSIVHSTNIQVKRGKQKRI